MSQQHDLFRGASFRVPPEEGQGDVLVVVATYNEVENIADLVHAIFDALPHAWLLVIDDNSPDGTGDWCDEYARSNDRFCCIHREGKLGLGSASILGFQFALFVGADYVLTLDADFSHPPAVLPALLDAIQPDAAGDEPRTSVAVGSRYTAGGGVEGWPLSRRVMSRMVNWYARLALRLPIRDCSGAFRGYRTNCFRTVAPQDIESQGYSYLEELLWRLKRSGATFQEVPFTFRDREKGVTKINLREAWQALICIARLGLREWFGPSPSQLKSADERA